MALECNTKFEEKLALGFKNDMINLVNFNESRSLLSIAYKVAAKKM